MPGAMAAGGAGAGGSSGGGDGKHKSQSTAARMVGMAAGGILGRQAGAVGASIMSSLRHAETSMERSLGMDSEGKAPVDPESSVPNVRPSAARFSTAEPVAAAPPAGLTEMSQSPVPQEPQGPSLGG